MVVGILWVLLLLMAAIDMDKLLWSSEEKRTAREMRRREEILERLKEQEAKIRLLHIRVKKEIAELEARQEEALKTPALAQERKMQQFMYKALFLVAFILFKLWR